jgi:hypothetical protein
MSDADAQTVFDANKMTTCNITLVSVARAVEAAVALGVVPDPRLHGEGRCVPVVPSVSWGTHLYAEASMHAVQGGQVFLRVEKRRANTPSFDPADPLYDSWSFGALDVESVRFALERYDEMVRGGGVPASPGPFRCDREVVPAVPSPTESVVTEEMADAAVAAYEEYDARMRALDLAPLKRIRMVKALEAALGARSRAAAPPEPGHVDSVITPEPTDLFRYDAESASGVPLSGAAALEQASPEGEIEIVARAIMPLVYAPPYEALADSDRYDLRVHAEAALKSLARARSQASPPALTEIALIEAVAKFTFEQTWPNEKWASFGDDLEGPDVEDVRRRYREDAMSLLAFVDSLRARSHASPPALTLAQIEAAVNETIIPSEREHFLRHVRALLGCVAREADRA